MAKVIYPPGCRALNEDLGTEELIRRLKTLANALQPMGQVDSSCQQFVPLALLLIDDFYISHPSRDVQLLVACCIADFLRVYAPETPYKDQDQMKLIFTFFIQQLEGLKDPKDPSFKRYFYLLENLAFVKSFSMCFDIEEGADIIFELFSMIFRIISGEHSTKVKNLMQDMLTPLITEADHISKEFLDLLLINIVEPNRSQNKYRFQLSEQMIAKTGDSLEPAVKIFFNQALVMGKVDKSLSITHKLYELIYEINKINPDILCSVLPQLETKSQSIDDNERMKVTTLLARMFSEPNSQLARKYQPLLRTFLGRFTDKSVAIRVKCVQSAMHFLINHHNLHSEVIECLTMRNHDPDEVVRHEVVVSIVETAKRNFELVARSMHLLEIVRERTLDKKYKIRRDAMNGLGFIYKQAICEPNNCSEELKESVDWIKNKILHGYYQTSIEDRLLVERLLISCLVPYRLPPEDRMKKLYHLLGNLDENATKAFIELQKSQMKMRLTVGEWVKLHHAKEMTPILQNQLKMKQKTISKLLPDPAKTGEYLTQLSASLRSDAGLRNLMDIILKRDVTCKECADAMSVILRKSNTPGTPPFYYTTVKMLVERIASVMVDQESIRILIGLVEKCVKGSNIYKEIGISRREAGEQGLKLLSMLSYVFPAYFISDNTLLHLVAILSYEEEYVAPLVLKSLTHLGRYKPLVTVNAKVLEELAPICKEFALSGTPKQAKHAVRCIYVNIQPKPIPSSSCNAAKNAVDCGASEEVPVVHHIFNEIIDTLRITMTPNSDNHQTKIVTLGHIAYLMPQTFQTPIKNMIARRIVKELLIEGLPQVRDVDLPEGTWCSEEDLPSDTLCKVEGLKAMARWLLGLRNDEHAAQKTFRMLNAFLSQGGDLLEQNLLSEAEKSWLRLGAGCAMLKICEQKGVGDQYSAEQFFQLSRLMNDPVLEVREIFSRKLHRGLGKGLPRACLPLDFMGLYTLAGHETTRSLVDQLKHFIETDVNRRREYIKTVSLTSPERVADSQTLHILPDFMLAFAIAVLVNDPAYTSHKDRSQLRKVEKCLRFVLDALMAKREAFVYSFYKNVIDMIKHHEHCLAKDGPEDILNLKMWAAADLALYIIDSKIGQCDEERTPFELPINLPPLYYKAPADANFQNRKVYIPLDEYTLGERKPANVKAAQIRLGEKRVAEQQLEPENNTQENDLFDNIRSTETTNVANNNKRLRIDKSND